LTEPKDNELIALVARHETEEPFPVEEGEAAAAMLHAKSVAAE